MREFEYEFSKGLARGLRKDSKNPRNNEWLVVAYNVKVGEYGLEPYDPITDFNSLLAGGSDTGYVEDGYVEDGYVE